MGIITTAQLEKGMVLDADLVTETGMFLMPRGTVLEPQHIQSMETWGITEVSVQGAGSRDVAAQSFSRYDPEVLQEAKACTRKLFRLCNGSHEAVRELGRQSLSRAAERLNKGGRLQDQDPLSGASLEQELADQPGRKTPRSPVELVRNEVLLSSFPDIYYQITRTLKDPTSSSESIADVIGKDQSLSAKLLQLVNSPFYGFPSRIDSLARAVTLTGTRELTMLAMSISVMSQFKDIPESLFDMKEFWKHSIACGIFAKLLAQRKGLKPEERYFLAGLLHDIGRLVLLKHLPRETRKAMLTSRIGGIPLFQAEKEIFGFDHSSVAGLLLMEWNFPDPLTYLINHHHRPERAENPLDPAILHLADIMALGLRMGASGSVFVPPLEQRAWEILDIPSAALATLAAQADEQFLGITRSFLQEP